MNINYKPMLLNKIKELLKKVPNNSIPNIYGFKENIVLFDTRYESMKSIQVLGTGINIPENNFLVKIKINKDIVSRESFNINDLEEKLLLKILDRLEAELLEKINYLDNLEKEFMKKASKTDIKKLGNKLISPETIDSLSEEIINSIELEKKSKLWFRKR